MGTLPRITLFSSFNKLKNHLFLGNRILTVSTTWSKITSRNASSHLPSTFKIERYLGKYEYSTRYLLSCSDAEALSIPDLVAMADPNTKILWENLKLSYTEMTGDPLLRAEIAQVHGVDKEDVMVVVPQEGIYIAMNCLMDYLKRQNNNESFHAVAVYPAYTSLYEILQSQNCDLSYWTTRLTPTGWTFDMNELKKSVKPNTRLLVVNFPHNPTGFLPSLEEWNEVIEFCKERDIFIFSDEMYSFTNNDGTEANPSACSVYENSISLFGMSKSFALPGLRLGWLCTRNTEVFTMMCHLKDYITICAPAPSEVLSLMALQKRELVLEHTMNIIRGNLKISNEFFSRHTDIFEWHPPRAGTTAFVRLKGWLLDVGAGGAMGFSEKLLKEKEVLVLPAKMYDFPDEYIRLGFGRNNLKECLEPLEEFINENKPNKSR